jgi:hypothetical protein
MCVQSIALMTPHKVSAICWAAVSVLALSGMAQATGSVQACVLVANNSAATQCAEEDNVNIPLFGDVDEFVIEARHPAYSVTTFDCPPNFSNCPQSGDGGFEFEPASSKLHDDGTWVLWVYREATFWRPTGMTVKAGGHTFADAHRIAVSKKVAGENSWPQFLVLYADGNLRLIPHPPKGASSVCFGASVIVGPSQLSSRPYAQISLVEFDSSKKSLSVEYEEGGTAKLAMVVDRTIATVTVQADFPSGCLPFATFRSMFVGPDNCDTAWVTVRCQNTDACVRGVLDPFVCLGQEFQFTRTVPSVHNVSAPDITIRVTDPNTTACYCPDDDSMS